MRSATSRTYQQGDLFSNCPLAVPKPTVYERLLAEETGAEITGDVAEDLFLVSYTHVIVLSQSCDLAKSDCTEVLVCVCQETTNYSEDMRVQIAKDRVAALHMIESCDSEGVQFPQQIIDFRAIYTLPKDFLLDLAKVRGKRVRLLPPYREHMAQAFARFFMRVGLPRNLKSD
jgi:hypothetical protein